MDEWVVEQFHKKNFAVLGQGEGIHFIDRCPLDPLTFGPPEKRQEKAKNSIDRITEEAVGRWSVAILFCWIAV